MSNIKDKVTGAAETVAETAADAVDFVREKAGIGCSSGKDFGVLGVRERMDVIASCGTKVGVVDHVDGRSIKLTRTDSPDGQHHYIPTGWVDHVDAHVHLKTNSVETERGWKLDAASCGGA